MSLRSLPLLSALLGLTALAPVVAHADYFFWQDPKTGASLTFPDNWRMINNQKPDDLVTLIGPSQDDRPICRLRARGDNRFTVYPVWYSGDVQDVAYNRNFWEAYTGEYDNVNLRLYDDNAGIGKAWASMAVATFTEATPKDEDTKRTSQMWSGVYHDDAFVFDCSSTSVSFDKWQPDFTGIAHSVDMRKVIHENVNGHYRDFVTEQKVMTHPVMNGDEKMGRTFD